jgi:hypothetical protein
VRSGWPRGSARCLQWPPGRLRSPRDVANRGDRILRGRPDVSRFTRRTALAARLAVLCDRIPGRVVNWRHGYVPRTIPASNAHLGAKAAPGAGSAQRNAEARSSIAHGLRRRRGHGGRAARCRARPSMLRHKSRWLRANGRKQESTQIARMKRTDDTEGVLIARSARQFPDACPGRRRGIRSHCRFRVIRALLRLTLCLIFAGCCQCRPSGVSSVTIWLNRRHALVSRIREARYVGFCLKQPIHAARCVLLCDRVLGSRTPAIIRRLVAVHPPPHIVVRRGRHLGPNFRGILMVHSELEHQSVRIPDVE